MERATRNQVLTMGTFAEAFNEMPTTLGEPKQALAAKSSTAVARQSKLRLEPKPALAVEPKVGRRVALTAEALVSLKGGRLTVHNLGATGGVFVNGAPLAQSSAVSEGDYLQLGGLELFVCESLVRATGRKALVQRAAPAKREEEDLSEFLKSDEDGPEAEAAAAGVSFQEFESNDEVEQAEEADEECAEVADDDASDDVAEAAVETEEIEADEAGQDEGAEGEEAGEIQETTIPAARSQNRVFALAAALTAAILLTFVGFVFAGRNHVDLPSFDEMLEPGLAALHQGDFDHAVQEFGRLEEMYPESRIPRVGLEIARLFRSETDPFLFDWGKADGMYRDLAGLDESTKAVTAFAKKQSEWVQREKACAEMIYQAQEHVEKADFENALALYEQIEKDYADSDLRMAVKADLVKLRVALRKDYVAHAEKALEGKSPDWTAAIVSYEKALRFFAQPDAEIADAIESCRKNFDVKVKLANADQMAKNGRLDDALDGLDKVALGSHYDRALISLKTNVVNEKKYQEAIKLYRNKDARAALDVLAGQPEERGTKLAERIKTVMSALAEGKRLFQSHDYVECLPHLEIVRKAESDNANPFLAEAAQLHKQARARIHEVAEGSFSKGMQALDEARYLGAIEEFKKLARYDTDGSLTDKVRRKVELEAAQLMKEVKGHFWTSTPTESDQVILDLLIRYLAQENTVRAEALRFKNNIEEAKMKDAAKASVLPKR